MQKPIVVCLHGWGGSGESFAQLRAALAGSAIQLLTPDLPGFGNEPEPNIPWTVSDYANWVEAWVKGKIGSTPFHLLGHSHGGRVAIVMAAKGTLPIEHLSLCASAGIPHRHPLKEFLGFVLSKCGKALLSLPGLESLVPKAKELLYKFLHVHDYERASHVMRETMRNVKREDLRSLLPQIKVSTDIFWGTEDTMTPVGDATLMHKAITNSRLHVFPGIRHRVHRDRAKEIAAVIIQTLPHD